MRDLRRSGPATDQIDSATSGLIAILELHRRASNRSDSGWLAADGGSLGLAAVTVCRDG